MTISERLQALAWGGLRPKRWLCVGAGYVREDVKAILLEHGQAYVGETVLSPTELAQRITGVAPERCLGPMARQEALRMLLAERRISARFPELKRLRRQSTFFKRLDRALQRGRQAFTHRQEQAVISERLTERLGFNPIRAEVEVFAAAYEGWLEAMELWDGPRLLRAAIARLEAVGRSEAELLGRLPAELWFLSAQSPESLEQSFWEQLSRHLELHRLGPEGVSEAAATADPDAVPQWDRWHTLDDAAEALAGELADEIASGTAKLKDREDYAILIPDLPAIRRSLRRALEGRGIPIADPRDPTRVRWDESLKWALLPLEVVGHDFERDRVVSWMHAYPPLARAWAQEVFSRGIRQGLSAYAGGKLELLHEHLNELKDALGGKRTAAELAEAHLQVLRIAVGEDSSRFWLLAYFENLWDEFIADFTRVGQGDRRAPLRYWLERFQARLEESPPPVDRVRPEGGIALYRLGQAPLKRARKLWVFGLPARYLVTDAGGDYWYSEREREVLSQEFGLRSAVHARQERLGILQEWLRLAHEVRVLDAHYDWDGRERESLKVMFRELGRDPDALPLRELGAHPRFLPSYSAIRPVSPLSVQLRPMLPRDLAPVPQIRASELESYSRCGFQALGGYRWRLQDLREPEVELWGNERGTLLHEAVRILIESRDAQGRFSVDVETALDRAWQTRKPRGLLRGERVSRQARERLLPVLRRFCETEREYVERAGTQILSLEGPELRLKYDDLEIYGIPDRIDQSEEGLFVLDYKTSSSIPKGKEMLDKGYRLQLPFYALAAQKHFGKPAVGAQFVELNRKGGRSKGIFFTQFNGKEPGKLTQLSSRNSSLLPGDPQDAWSESETQILRQARRYISGAFEAKPGLKTECAQCFYSDFCGKRRVIEAEAENEGEEGGHE